MVLGPLLFFLVLIRTSFGLYGGDSSVISLTPQNFDDKVKGSDEVWIVEYFAPWCGHCKAFAPEFSKAAKALKGVVRVGAVDCDAHQSLAGQYGIQGFPTVKIFGTNKHKPQDYQGPRTAAGLIDAAFKELRKVVDSRIGRKTSESKSDSKDVIELDSSNFKETVLQSNDMWLVEFYAPWCGHCKNLAPHWASAASQLKGKVKLGAVDATTHTDLASKYGVRGYPTIKFFPAGAKTGEPEDYNGGRTAEDIVNWALEKVADSAPPPKVKQITSSEDLTEACMDKQICIVSILPQLLDCQSKCRNEYLDVLQKIADKYRRNNWGWLWAEAIAQPSLEDSLGIGGFGYPAMAAVNARKMKYSILRGSFSFDGINEFMREVAVGRGASAPLKGAKLPDIVKSEPWDGKDAELPVEEDIDLSDVTFDDETPKSEL